MRYFEHAWLKESCIKKIIIKLFIYLGATYMESCWFEDQKGKEFFEYTMFLNSLDYFQVINIFFN